MNLQRYYPKKRFGQHWLVNDQILDKIIETSELNSKDFILEIGPGKGALTSKILKSNINRLHAVELDRDLINHLKNKFEKYEKFSIQEGDILNVDLTPMKNKITKVIANIPYNITGPILDLFIGKLGNKTVKEYDKIIFLMQKEVVDRIVAEKGSSNIGALSTRIKLISEVTKICDVQPSAFDPPPKVISSLVVFKPLSTNKRVDTNIEKYIDKLLKLAFNSLRKKLKNTLSSLLTKEEINQLELSSNINFNLRPQDLSVDDWINIASICIKMDL